MKDGREGDFQAGQQKYIVEARSNNDVVSVTKFNVNEEILEVDPNSFLYFPSENNEMMITVYEDR